MSVDIYINDKIFEQIDNINKEIDNEYSVDKYIYITNILNIKSLQLQFANFIQLYLKPNSTILTIFNKFDPKTNYESIDYIFKLLYDGCITEMTTLQNPDVISYVKLLLIKSLIIKTYISIWAYDSYYLYGASYLDFIEYRLPEYITDVKYQGTNVKYYIFGEHHISNIINMPKRTIYMYKLFEKLIELNIKQNRHVHVFLEGGGIRYKEKQDINKENTSSYIYNCFLVDACDVYYYLNICQRYLFLDPAALYIKQQFENLVSKYNLDKSILSNFINDKDSVTFHYIDNRSIAQNFIKNILPLVDNKENLLSMRFLDNMLIFPEKIESKFKNQINGYLLPILIQSGKENITIYRKLYDELYNAGYINEDICDRIDSTTNLNKKYKDSTSTVPYIMDHITILKFLYLEYKRGSTEETILFHGGQYHSEVYSKVLSLIIKNEPVNKQTILKDENEYNDLEIVLLDIHSLINKVSDINIICDSKIEEENYSVYVYKDILYNDIKIFDNYTYAHPYSINKEFIASCKSQMDFFNYDADKKEDFTGGQDYMPLQQIQIYTPQQRQLTALEQVELAELRLFFKDVDIIKSVENLLEFSQLDSHAKQMYIEENLTGGGIFRNPWLRFLLG